MMDIPDQVKKINKYIEIQKLLAIVNEKFCLLINITNKYYFLCLFLIIQL